MAARLCIRKTFLELEEHEKTPSFKRKRARSLSLKRPATQNRLADSEDEGEDDENSSFSPPGETAAGHLADLRAANDVAVGDPDLEHGWASPPVVVRGPTELQQVGSINPRQRQDTETAAATTAMGAASGSSNSKGVAPWRPRFSRAAASGLTIEAPDDQQKESQEEILSYPPPDGLPLTPSTEASTVELHPRTPARPVGGRTRGATQPKSQQPKSQQQQQRPQQQRHEQRQQQQQQQRHQRQQRQHRSQQDRGQQQGQDQQDSKRKLRLQMQARVRDEGVTAVRGTTLMMQNIPKNYDRDDMVDHFREEGFDEDYDFLFVPVDFANPKSPNYGLSKGYAFVNTTSLVAARQFMLHFEGFHAWRVQSRKRCAVTWSEIMGLEANIARWRNSPIMHEKVPAKWKPLWRENGKEKQFPAPTKQTLRRPRKDTKVLELPASATSSSQST